MEFQHCYFELGGSWLVGVGSRHDVEGFHAYFFACRAAKKQVRDLMAWRLHNNYPSEGQNQRSYQIRSAGLVWYLKAVGRELFPQSAYSRVNNLQIASSFTGSSRYKSSASTRFNVRGQDPSCVTFP